MEFCGGCLEPENSLENHTGAGVSAPECVHPARWLEHSFVHTTSTCIGGVKLIHLLGDFYSCSNQIDV